MQVNCDSWFPCSTMTKLPKEVNYCNTEPISINDFEGVQMKKNQTKIYGKLKNCMKEEVEQIEKEYIESIAF